METLPSKQNFTPGSYDLIIASQCLHATKNMTRTMQHTRELLKPGGKVVMVEGTREALDISFIFGTLSGWWLGEEETRQLTPCLDVQQWDEVLRDTGFNGTELVIPNCDREELHTLSVIVSTAV
ncbi:S-adenosyl-L-methionine-dependent methyltransferase [Periconia macrospinosa]|uniref:S-adenosyl-L-methionine-dependent methyltransferase n=1 Tax=Periconia macrospinosa TaxID=97972 RepID=A0A2V1E1Z4_9PLEO|nr:S-adenosyl-L-methionine-dependent methyltransferase [Periconia macrospinosa]